MSIWTILIPLVIGMSSVPKFVMQIVRLPRNPGSMYPAPKTTPFLPNELLPHNTAHKSAGRLMYSIVGTNVNFPFFSMMSSALLRSYDEG